MESKLAARIREIFEQGGGEVIGASRFIPLVTLDSGTCLGLDAEVRWLSVPDDGAPAALIGEDNVHLLHEALEWKRDRFDETLEQAASAQKLPSDETVLAFPAIPLVRAVLSKRVSYLTRLALWWLRPTELRDLRDALIAVTRDPSMPIAIREYAERLVLPE